MSFQPRAWTLNSRSTIIFSFSSTFGLSKAYSSVYNSFDWLVTNIRSVLVYEVRQKFSFNYVR